MDEFQLQCPDCSYSEVVEGDIDDVFDRIEAHRAGFEADPRDHSVNFERIGPDG